MILIEASWEVCNKVGGIYTVVSTKSKYIKENFRGKYLLVGPFLRNTSEFEEKKIPRWLENIKENLKKQGIKIHYGRWLIEGRPTVILIDFYDFMNKEKNFWKYKYWEWYRIDSLYSDYTFDEPLLWSVAIGKFLEELDKKFPYKKIYHAHEWLAGGAILYVKKKGLNYLTIFTTHGTVLGRAISSSNIDFLKIIKNIIPDQEAYKYHIHFKHQLEKKVAENCDIFTTVSDIIAKECEILFNRKPDYVIYNGIDLEEEDIIKKYYNSRKLIEEFVLWYFYPYCEIDLENTLFMYTIGRYEFFNKGYDLVIDLLDYLNKTIDFNIIFFFFVPSSISALNKKVIKNKEIYENIKRFIDENKEGVIFDLMMLFKKKKVKMKYLSEIKKMLYNMEKHGNPPIITHDLTYQNDPILTKLSEKGLDNSKDKKVKVVFIPAYLGMDNIFNEKPSDLLPGFDLGVFLSRYEPFGYTGLEALSFGVPIILSSRTGFCNALKNYNIKDIVFVYEIDNLRESRERALEFIEKYKNLDIGDRLELKAKCISIAKEFSWERLVKKYLDIYLNILK